MPDQEAVITAFEEPIAWARSLKRLKPDRWLVPTAPGAWSVGGCLAHLLAWDRYLLDYRLPLIHAGAQLPASPGDEALNGPAAAYASATPQDALIEEFVAVRGELARHCRELSSAEFEAPFTINGIPFSFHAYLDMLIEHDCEHQAELAPFLARDSAASAH